MLVGQPPQLSGLSEERRVRPDHINQRSTGGLSREECAAAELLPQQKQHMSTTHARETIDVKVMRDDLLVEQREAADRAREQREAAARDGG